MQVSHSRVETFKKCPYQFKLRYKEGLQTYFNCDPANPLIIGTALHTGIEKDTETAIKEYYANYPIITDKNIDEAIKLEAVIQKCRDALPPLDNALFETEINCPEFIGFIDLLVPVEAPRTIKKSVFYDVPEVNPVNGEVCEVRMMDTYDEYVNEPNNYEWFDMYDFKYSNNIKNYMESGQLHEYKFYFERLNPTKRIRNMYFLFAPKVAIRQKYKNKTNKRDETLGEFRKRIDQELENKNATLVEVPYEPEKVKEFLRNAKECREATTFPKNPTRLCDWCEFQKYCESEEREDLDIMSLPSTERRTIEANNRKKIWFYGMPFSGKTYLANQFPTPLMLNTDGNYKFVDAPVIPIKDEVTQEGRVTKRKFAWEVFQDAVDDLEKGSDFETIILDLTEDIYDFCRVKVCNDKGWEHESDDSFKAYDIVRSEFLRTIKRLIALDYNIVLISHEDTSRDITKKSSDKVTQIKPNIPEKVAAKLAGMVDIVARVIHDGDTYTVSFKTNDVIFGGGRLKIDAKEIPADYEELCAVYEEANKGKKKEKVNKTAATKPDEEVVESRVTEQKSDDVETADAPPVDVETADAPPKRKTRTTKPKTEETGSNETKTEEKKEVKTTDGSNEAPAEEEKPARRRRRRTE